jgi:hypothetical protein
MDGDVGNAAGDEGRADVAEFEAFQRFRSGLGGQWQGQ